MTADIGITFDVLGAMRAFLHARLLAGRSSRDLNESFIFVHLPNDAGSKEGIDQPRYANSAYSKYGTAEKMFHTSLNEEVETAKEEAPQEWAK